MDEAVYGRVVILKNCGRFLNIASDFGSEYKTHPFLTEQMVYAGLTRENEMIGESELRIEKGVIPDKYDFNSRYSIPNGRYFTCGYLLDKGEFENDRKIIYGNKNRYNSDVNDFNSIDETNAGVQTNKQLPKFGNIESIIPNNYFLTFAFSREKEYLDKYYVGQTFYMGKKRTMFQIETLSEIALGNQVNDKIREADIELPIQVTNKEINKFEYYSILTITQRYILVKGKPRKELNNFIWSLKNDILIQVSLPDFFVNNRL